MEPLRRWELFLGISKSPTTVRTRVDSMARVARGIRLPPREVTFEALTAWFTDQQWSLSTRKSMYQATRQFFEWAVADGLVETSPANEFRGVTVGPPAPRPLPEEALLEAFMACDQRTWLAIRLACDLGMRRAEVARVHISDLAQECDGWALYVTGKGSKTRRLPIPGELAAAVTRACAQSENGYAFPGKTEGHLSAERIGRLVRSCLPPGWSMHSLRHRFATRAYNLGNDLISVQQLLGHSSVATTQRYVGVDHDKLRKIVEDLQW